MTNKKNIRFFRDPAINGIEISKVESSRHVFPKHAHDDIFAFSLITSGASYCLGKEDSDLTVSQGEIVTLNPGQVHSGIPVNDRPISYWMLYTDVETMEYFAGDILEKKGIIPEFQSMVINSRSLAIHFLDLVNAFEKQSDTMEKDFFLNEFFGKLLQYTWNTRPVVAHSYYAGESLEIAKSILSENLDIGISLDCVARKIGLSRFHFIRQFKRHTGVSPHQFRIQRRIEAARGLIRKGVPFSDIALETGFVDQSHFTNKFRQYTGATPSQYARS